MFTTIYCKIRVIQTSYCKPHHVFQKRERPNQACKTASFINETSHNLRSLHFQTF